MVDLNRDIWSEVKEMLEGCNKDKNQDDTKSELGLYLHGGVSKGFKICWFCLLTTLHHRV